MAGRHDLASANSFEALVLAKLANSYVTYPRRVVKRTRLDDDTVRCAQRHRPLDGHRALSGLVGAQTNPHRQRVQCNAGPASNAPVAHGSRCAPTHEKVYFIVLNRLPGARNTHKVVMFLTARIQCIFTVIADTIASFLRRLSVSFIRRSDRRDAVEKQLGTRINARCRSRRGSSRATEPGGSTACGRACSRAQAGEDRPAARRAIRASVSIQRPAPHHSCVDVDVLRLERGLREPQLRLR